MSVEREFPRFAIDAEIVIRGANGRPITTGRATNLSRGGLAAELGAGLERGARVEVGIALIFETDSVSEPLSLPARVVWSTSIETGHQAGLAFLPLDRERTRYLDMFIRFLEGDDDHDEPPPPPSKGRFDV